MCRAGEMVWYLDEKGSDICMLSPQLVNCLGRIRRCDLVGGGVALLEEVWPCWRKCGFVGGTVSL